jgi:hypothetical protein
MKYDANPGGFAQSKFRGGECPIPIPRSTLIAARQFSKIFDSVHSKNLPYLDSLRARVESRQYAKLDAS